MDRNAFAGVEEFLTEIYIKVDDREKVIERQQPETHVERDRKEIQRR